MSMSWTCPVCGEIIESAVWDDEAGYWINPDDGSVVVMTLNELVNLPPPEDPYMPREPIVLHSH